MVNLQLMRTRSHSHYYSGKLVTISDNFWVISHNLTFVAEDPGTNEIPVKNSI